MMLNFISRFQVNVQNKMKKKTRIIVIRCDVFNFLLSIENRNLQRQVEINTIIHAIIKHTHTYLNAPHT